MRKIKPTKDKYMLGGQGMPKKSESKPIYPIIRIDLNHIPEAKKWEIGKEYEVDMKLKMVGISQSRFDNSAEFEIREIGPEGADESTEDKPGEEQDPPDEEG